MKLLGLYMIFLLLVPGSLPAQEHVLRYHPEGGDFVIVNGTHRFNRALYGTHTAARVEAGDTNTAIDGGAATALDMPLHADKVLDHLTLTAIANDVVIGLMSVTLIKTTE
jgi:hypothetical protein